MYCPIKSLLFDTVCGFDEAELECNRHIAGKGATWYIEDHGCCALVQLGSSLTRLSTMQRLRLTERRHKQ